MISTTERGHHIGKLVRYLFGPGRHEEHTHQRVVACSDPTWVGTTPDAATLTQLIAELDDSHARYGERTSKGHVWHLIVAVPAVDGDLSDAQWRRAADLFAERLGLGDGHVAWAAVNHGRSIKGNDHIHMVVNLIRDDGRVVNLWRDAFARREVCRQLESEFGLTATAAAGDGNGQALSRYESETLRATAGATLLPRHRLTALVRAAATAAETELEFIRTLRGQGIILRPRVDKTDPTRVVGYSVALPGAQTGGTLVWFGGGTLARDLRLPALRAGWPHSTRASARQWRAARPGRVPHARPGDLAAARHALDEIAVSTQWLTTVDASQRHHVIRDGVGLLAAAASATRDPWLQRALLSACRAVDRAVAELPAPTPPPLTLSTGRHAVRVCRTVLAAARPGARDHGLDGLLLQITQLTAQITDLMLTRSQTRAALAAAAASRHAAELAAAAARPRGWHLASTTEPIQIARSAPTRSTDPSTQPVAGVRSEQEQLPLIEPGA